MEFLGTKYCQLLFCLALLAFIGLSCTLKAKYHKISLKYVQFPVFDRSHFFLKKKERSGQLKYIQRKEVERNFGKNDGFPTFSNPQSLLKIHYLYIKCIVEMEYESENSYYLYSFCG